MKQDWQQLQKLINNYEVIIKKVYIPDLDLHIEGEFLIPDFMKLSNEDQIFASCFIQSGGSIKEMEKLFGISYPSVKNRLKKISAYFSQVQITNINTDKKMEILERIDRGEISVEQAMEELL
jgi:hypothetical protein